MWVLVLGFLSLLTYAYLNRATTGQLQKEFSGKIVNKFITTFESETGSSFTRYLEIVDKAGKHRNLSVNEDIYTRAEPGVWIEVKRSGMRLFQPEKELGSQ